MTNEKDSTLVNFNCPIKLLKDFDEAIQDYYSDRTAALHDLMRKFIQTWKPKEKNQL